MKKLVYALVGVALIAVGAYFAFVYKSCQEPDDMVVALTALSCAQQVLNKEPQQLRAEFCEYLQRGPECDLQEEDRPKLIEMIDGLVGTCLKDALAKENYCTDKVDEMLRR
jgi:hypothetical protein